LQLAATDFDATVAYGYCVSVTGPSGAVQFLIADKPHWDND